MVAPLAVFGFVVDHALLNLDLTGIEITLVVGSVIPGIPQGKLNAGKKGK